MKNTSTASRASASVAAMITPFPAASPSALSTTGYEAGASCSSASSLEPTTVWAAVGIPASSISRLGEQLRSLDLRGGTAGPEGGDACVLQRVDEPRDERRLRVRR